MTHKIVLSSAPTEGDGKKLIGPFDITMVEQALGRTITHRKREKEQHRVKEGSDRAARNSCGIYMFPSDKMNV